MEWLRGQKQVETLGMEVDTSEFDEFEISVTRRLVMADRNSVSRNGSDTI